MTSPSLGAVVTQGRIGAQLGEILGRGIIGKKIDRVRLHCGIGCGGIADEAVFDCGQRRLSAPIIVIADQLQPISARPALIAEGPCPHRIRGEPVRRTRCDHHAIAPGEQNRQAGIGRLEANAHCQRIERVDARDFREPFGQRVG